MMSIDSVALESAARTAVHTGLLMSMHAFLPPIGERFSTVLPRIAREVYALHRRMLARPEVLRALRAGEREDLLLLPLFLGSIPLDIARVLRKRITRQVRLPVEPPDDFPYPAYYLNDFHNQKNGNLSLQAALTYEWQIRVLFAGANRLMRQMLIDEIPRGDQLRVLDVACGTGAWITMARAQGRDHHVTGVDLSPAYLRVARALRRRRTQFLQRNAEQLDASWSERFDLVTNIWLLHELPRPAQDRAVAEMARVLKPGGALLLMDAMQLSDLPTELPAEIAARYKNGNDYFASHFNEPYFKAYQRRDIPALLAAQGLTLERTHTCFRSTLWVARKS